MIHIPLSRNKVAIVDDKDYELLSKHKWSVSSAGYAKRSIKKGKDQKTIYLHRFIMNVPQDMEIDHINGDRLDNRKWNLRICTAHENRMNTGNVRENKTSKYKGVCWDKIRKKWFSQITVRNKCIKLGRYNDEIDAAMVYDKMAIRYFGEYSNLNFKEVKI